MPLLGRASECAVIDRLLEGARRGESGAVLIRGVPGIGKSSLLRYATDNADGMSVLTTAGVEAESELAYSGLSRLLQPLHDRLATLPDPQRRALAGALGVGLPSGDRLAAYAATLSLLAAAAEDGPVLGAIDDLHWLDTASREALLFTARRLHGEGIVLLFAARDDGALARSVGVPEIHPGGLGRDASHLLLAELVSGALSRAVSHRLHRLTEGNPLALVEIVALLTPEQLAGTQSTDDPLPATGSVEENYRQRVELLPSDTRQLLVLAAASDSGEMDVLVAAARGLGLDAGQLERAESAGLVTIAAGNLEWRHPLLRSAAYHSAPASERRSAHGALAGAIGGRKAHEQAWHLAAAAVAPDETIAAALDRAGLDARARGGHAAASRAFERAARLSPAAEDRARRLLNAGQDASVVGDVDRAADLLIHALAATRDPRTRADVQLARSRLMLWLRSPLDARELLLAEAAQVADNDPERATGMIGDAVVVSTMTGECVVALDMARRAVVTARLGGSDAQAIAEAVLCNALILIGEAVEARPLLARCRKGYEGSVSADKAHAIFIQSAAHGSIWVEDYDEARHVLRRTIAAVRSANALFLLPFPLSLLSELDFRTGRWMAAEVGALEALRIAAETGQANLSSYSHVCLAYVEAGQGRENDCRRHVALAREAADAMGLGSILSYAAHVLGLLELGLQRADEAIVHFHVVAELTRVQGLVEPAVIPWQADLVEAYIKTKRLEEAKAALHVLDQQAQRTERAWALAAASRCRGMLADDDHFDQHFTDALRWHDRKPTYFERARTELSLGERLRRARRRGDARIPLRAALNTFERLGATPWAERARAELRASGENRAPNGTTDIQQLTSQELQVAVIIAEGATNRDAAAALFLSPKTVEFHLGNVYRKLGIHSRSELARLVATRQLAARVG